MLVNVLPQGNPLSSRTVLPLLTMMEAGFRSDASVFDKQRRAILRSVDRSPTAAIDSLITVNAIATRLVQETLSGRPSIAHILEHLREDYQGCCAVCDEIAPSVSAWITNLANETPTTASVVQQQIMVGVLVRDAVARINAVITMSCVGWLAAELEVPKLAACRLLCESVIAYRPQHVAA